MAKFVAKYTSDQKDEACRLVNECGLNPRQAHQRLLEGSNGVPPFRMPLETIRRYSREARQKLVPKPEPGRELQDLTERCINLVHEELANLETQARQGERDLNKFAKIVSVLTDLDKLKKGNPPKKHQTSAHPLAQMASEAVRDLTKDRSTSRSTRQPKATTTTDTDPHEEQASGVLALASTLDRAA